MKIEYGIIIAAIVVVASLSGIFAAQTLLIENQTPAPTPTPIAIPAPAGATINPTDEPTPAPTEAPPTFTVSYRETERTNTTITLNVTIANGNNCTINLHDFYLTGYTQEGNTYPHHDRLPVTMTSPDQKLQVNADAVNVDLVFQFSCTISEYALLYGGDGDVHYWRS